MSLWKKIISLNKSEIDKVFEAAQKIFGEQWRATNEVTSPWVSKDKIEIALDKKYPETYFTSLGFPEKSVQALEESASGFRVEPVDNFYYLVNKALLIHVAAKVKSVSDFKDK